MSGTPLFAGVHDISVEMITTIVHWTLLRSFGNRLYFPMCKNMKRARCSTGTWQKLYIRLLLCLFLRGGHYLFLFSRESWFIDLILAVCSSTQKTTKANYLFI